MKKTTQGQPENLSRRNFIRNSTAGLFFLAISSRASQSDDNRNKIEGRWLTNEERAFLTTLLPVIISDTRRYDAAVLVITINNIDHYLQLLPVDSQQEFRDLLNILLSPGKGFFTGVWGSWNKVSTQAVYRFLEQWRTSSISLFRKAYNSLVQLCLITWYGMTHSWKAIHYPGPPHTQQLVTSPNHF